MTRGRADETTDEDNAAMIPAAPGHQASATAAAVSMDVEQIQELAPPEPIMEDPVELGLPQAVLDSRGPDDEDLPRCVSAPMVEGIDAVNNNRVRLPMPRHHPEARDSRSQRSVQAQGLPLDQRELSGPVLQRSNVAPVASTGPSGYSGLGRMPNQVQRRAASETVSLPHLPGAPPSFPGRAIPPVEARLSAYEPALAFHAMDQPPTGYPVGVRQSSQDYGRTEDRAPLRWPVSGRGDQWPATRCSSASQLQEPKISLPIFKGKSEWLVFWLQFERLAQCFGWTDEVTLDHLVSSLREDALDHYAEEATEVRANLVALVTSLRRPFGDRTLPETYRASLQTLKKQPCETLEEYAARVRKLANRAYPGISGTSLLEEMTIEYLVGGLTDQNLIYDVMTKKPRSVEAALDLIQWHESCRGVQRKRSGVRQLAITQGEDDTMTAVRRTNSVPMSPKSACTSLAGSWRMA